MLFVLLVCRPLFKPHQRIILSKLLDSSSVCLFGLRGRRKVSVGFIRVDTLVVLSIYGTGSEEDDELTMMREDLDEVMGR